LLDVVLPGELNGDGVARKLCEARPELRTLFMSGYTENAIVHHGRLDDGVHLNRQAVPAGRPGAQGGGGAGVTALQAGVPLNGLAPQPVRGNMTVPHRNRSLRMPLSQPEPRDELHTRRITLCGYQRADGLFDIEAHLVDTKASAFHNEDRGRIEAGEPLHGMGMRLTVDDRMTIVACEASTDHSPYAMCPDAAPNFARLAGLRIKPGFLKEAASRVGGTVGCTHLRELLQQMATVAFQTIGPVMARRRAREGEVADGGSARLLNTCIAYAADGPLVRRRWPHLAEAPKQAAAE
jgi:hypothetical protein